MQHGLSHLPIGRALRAGRKPVLLLGSVGAVWPNAVYQATLANVTAVGWHNKEIVVLHTRQPKAATCREAKTAWPFQIPTTGF